MKTIKFVILLLLCFPLIQCDGHECAATSTILTDQDSDCIEDASDNCPNDYNPNQEDTDEDTFGDACDEAPDNADEVGLNFTLDIQTYNLRGYYQSSESDCGDFDFDISQTNDELTVSEDHGEMYSGFLTRSFVSTTDLKNAPYVESQFANGILSCDMVYFPRSFGFTLLCEERDTGETCYVEGTRKLIYIY